MIPWNRPLNLPPLGNIPWKINSEAKVRKFLSLFFHSQCLQILEILYAPCPQKVLSNKSVSRNEPSQNVFSKKSLSVLCVKRRKRRPVWWARRNTTKARQRPPLLSTDARLCSASPRGIWRHFYVSLKEQYAKQAIPHSCEYPRLPDTPRKGAKSAA